MKYKMKMVAPEKSRIKKWFIGTMNGNYVEFKFTYSWNMGEQVMVKSEFGTILMGLEAFKSKVTPKIADKFYVLA